MKFSEVETKLFFFTQEFLLNSFAELKNIIGIYPNINVQFFTDDAGVGSPGTGNTELEAEQVH